MCCWCRSIACVCTERVEGTDLEAGSWNVPNLRKDGATRQTTAPGSSCAFPLQGGKDGDHTRVPPVSGLRTDWRLGAGSLGIPYL